MTNAATILRAARELIEKPDAWIQGDLAQAGGGNGVLATSPNAVCWCVLGAVYRAAGVKSAMAPIAYLRRSIDGSLVAWNDAEDRTHAEVLAALDRAIALAEREEV